MKVLLFLVSLVSTSALAGQDGGGSFMGPGPSLQDVAKTASATAKELPEILQSLLTNEQITSDPEVTAFVNKALASLKAYPMKLHLKNECIDEMGGEFVYLTTTPDKPICLDVTMFTKYSKDLLRQMMLRTLISALATQQQLRSGQIASFSSLITHEYLFGHESQSSDQFPESAPVAQ